jgi:hypothetical protein
VDVVHPAPRHVGGLDAGDQLVLGAAGDRAVDDASVSAAAARSAAISSPDFTSRSRVCAPERSTTRRPSAREAYWFHGSGPTRPTGAEPAPRSRSRSTTVAAGRSPAKRTSAAAARRRASGTWLKKLTSSTSGSPGVTRTCASRVTGQPVSQLTAAPDRFAP